MRSRAEQNIDGRRLMGFASRYDSSDERPAYRRAQEDRPFGQSYKTRAIAHSTSTTLMNLKEAGR